MVIIGRMIGDWYGESLLFDALVQGSSAESAWRLSRPMV